uniref:HBS1-like protein n=1 Tax=Styela clava TaxID=7725 RepID=UPI00193A1E8D|nr:HBS1-like protein [Styela clava]
MARHRNIRNAKSYDYDYDDDDIFGQSYEDDYGVSPGTMAQYSYSRSRRDDFSTFMPSESTVQEADEDAFDEMDRGGMQKSMNTGQKLQTGNEILIQSCIEMMHDVVGESYSDQAMKEAAIKADFDVERAINFLLSSPKTENCPIVTQSSGLEFSMNQPPLEQRQRRNRRNNNDSDISAPSTEKRKLNPNILANQGHVTKVVSSTTPGKTGFAMNNANQKDNGSYRNTNGVSSQPKKTKPNSGITSVNSSFKNLQIENGEVKKATIPKPSIPLQTLMVEKSESASLSPNVKQKSEEPQPSMVEYKNTKHAAEIIAKYEERMKLAKPLISMVVIGHVDAGKSTLMGHILYQSGEVSKRAMHKYEQESRKIGKASFAYAWVLDETGEERSRGVTMDVGLTRFETKNRVITLMDAPGHKDFIPNMITGASQADVAVLVINATTGEFEAGFDLGGQTREHSLLVRSLGIAQLAVAINKLDTVGWSQKRFNDIVSKLSSFLKQAGFKDSDVTFVPVSGLLGQNLTKLGTDEKLTSWYKGPCLVDVIDKFKPPQRPVDYPLRFCVTDVVRGQGTGINVSGKVETGGVKVGSKVVVLPAGEQSLVKGIEFHDGARAEVVLAGDHATLTCHGVDIMKIHTGNVLSDIKNPIPVVSRFQARIIIFNIAVPITRGFPVELHYKAASEPAVIKRLLSVLHKSTGEVVAKKPKVILKGQNVMVQMMTHRPICIEEYHKVKEMGRFTLRYGGSTIAAGVVTDVLK